ncbi:hypothetical protein EV361DRAFT_956422 [Lentinula raphanica]|nr:hypothetical protein EV361DRAFT_956422 [Lentinula raphanica]
MAGLIPILVTYFVKEEPANVGAEPTPYPTDMEEQKLPFELVGSYLHRSKIQKRFGREPLVGVQGGGYKDDRRRYYPFTVLGLFVPYFILENREMLSIIHHQTRARSSTCQQRSLESSFASSSSEQTSERSCEGRFTTSGLDDLFYAFEFKDDDYEIGGFDKRACREVPYDSNDSTNTNSSILDRTNGATGTTTRRGYYNGVGTSTHHAKGNDCLSTIIPL